MPAPRLAALALAVAVAVTAAPAAASRAPVLVSATSAGASGGGWSSDPTVTPDGRFVAFVSTAALVPQDTNGDTDIYRRDVRTGRTLLVGVSTGGGQPAGAELSHPLLSDDGRYVVFSTTAVLAPGAVRNAYNTYVRDVGAGRTTLLTVPGQRGWVIARAVSADGRRVLVDGPDGGVYRVDREGGGARRVDVSTAGVPANGYSSGAAVDASGRYALLVSESDNLVPGLRSGTLGPRRAYLHDTRTGRTQLVSRDVGGRPLVDHVGDVTMSRDARLVLFSTRQAGVVPGPAGTSFAMNLYARDRSTGDVRQVNVTSDGRPAGVLSDYDFAASLSPDGRRVAFTSLASDLAPGGSARRVDVYQHDLLTGTTHRLLDNASRPSAGLRAVAAATGDALVATDTNAAMDVYLVR